METEKKVFNECAVEKNKLMKSKKLPQRIDKLAKYCGPQIFFVSLLFPSEIYILSPPTPPSLAHRKSNISGRKLHICILQ